MTDETKDDVNLTGDVTDDIDDIDDVDDTGVVDDTGDVAPGTEAPAEQVEVRRNVVLSVVVGALSAALTVAFALRAFGEGSALDWALFAVLGLITVVHATAVADGRVPLLVADRLGVRLRQGAAWQGIAWSDMECLEHLPRRRPLRDGHLLVVGYDGQQLIVPLTLATRLVGASGETLSDELAELADGRADVVEVVPGLAEEGPDEDATAAADPVGAAAPDDDPERFAPAGPPAAENEAGYEDSGDTEDTIDSIPRLAAEASTDEIAAVPDRGADAPPPGPGRPLVAPARVEAQHARTHPTVGANALRVDTVTSPEGDAHADDVEHTLTVVLDDLVVQPAAEPVIGPQLRAARERLRLTVDQLSERTRIRPHVIEAIEVDDFGPCGGDFYARGHLRTLARVLATEAGPLVATYDEKYADAPVDPRRVFESELATGVGGSIRGTRGGRNWSVLVAAVMAAVLVWSIARLLMDGPVDVSKPPSLNQSGGVFHGQQKADAVPVTLTAAGGGANLVVRDGAGDIVFDGQLAFGQTSELKIVPPVRIWSSDGSVTASVDCKDPSPLGETGEEVTKTLIAC